MLRLPGHLGRPGARPARPTPRRAFASPVCAFTTQCADRIRHRALSGLTRPQPGSIRPPSPAPPAPCASQASHSGGPRPGAIHGARVCTPRCSRIRLICTPPRGCARSAPPKGSAPGNAWVARVLALEQFVWVVLVPPHHHHQALPGCPRPGAPSLAPPLA